MLDEYIFVSCDIVAHSAEPRIEAQVDRIDGINRAIERVLRRHDDQGLVWASGGDGGHVAIPLRPGGLETALELIGALRTWSRAAVVPLRICASIGFAKDLPGADGRTQLAGPGINLAGRLLPYGAAARVVVTDAFRDAVKGLETSAYRFHDSVRIEPKNSPPLVVWLMSSLGEFDSTWRQPGSADDRALLVGAVGRGDALEVIYRARRLLELNIDDTGATQALRSLGDMKFRGTRNFLHKLIQDEHIGAELIRLGSLIERRDGETVCSSGEGGTSMFLVLRGRLQVFFPSEAASREVEPRLESVVMLPGDLGGELAFALKRSRTATLQCLEDVALLTFTYEELVRSLAGSADGEGVKRALGKEILAKVLENFCNTSSFFRPVWAALSEPSKATPWTTLLPHSELVTGRAEAMSIDLPMAADSAELVFLVSGSLRAGTSGETWSGEGYPLLYAHLPPRMSRRALQLSLREDCQLLRIRREGLVRLGPDVHELVLRQVAHGMGPSMDSVAAAQGTPSESGHDLVFISYCRENQAEVAVLRDRLLAAGEAVWWDQDILPGSDWKLEIRRAMKRSYAVICCFSKELAARSRSGVYPELLESLRAARERRPGEVFLVPVRLSECEIPEIEIDDTRTLDRLQTLDLFSAAGESQLPFERLLAALQGARRPSARPRRPPPRPA